MIYKVVITETQRYTAEVEANSPEEAEQKVYDNHCAGEYDIDGSGDREETYDVCCPECGEYGAYMKDWVDPADASHNGLICEKCGYCTGW